MSRSADSTLMTSGYRKRIQQEIKRKAAMKKRPPKYRVRFRVSRPGRREILPDVTCTWCHTSINLGDKVHVQRSPTHVRVHHQSCWEGLYIESREELSGRLTEIA